MTRPASACLLLSGVILLVACIPSPDSYPIPPQHKAPGGSEPIVSFGDYVRATQSDAESYYLKDVRGLEGARFRWTCAQPEFRFFLKSASNRRFHMEFGISDVTFRDTGPLNLVLIVNGQEFDSVTYDSFGQKTYDKPVPPGLLNPNAENRVVVRVLNPWTSSDLNVKLGIVLVEAGFL